MTKVLQVPIRAIVRRISDDVIRISFHVRLKTPPQGIEIHHWDFSVARALELARTIVEAAQFKIGGDA